MRISPFSTSRPPKTSPLPSAQSKQRLLTQEQSGDRLSFSGSKRPREMESPDSSDSCLPLLKSIRLSTPPILIQYQQRAGKENRETSQGVTGLMLAAAEGNAGAVTSFLNNEQSINQQDNAGKTALHYAVEQNQPEVIDILIDRNASTAIMDNSDYTPVTLAAKSGNVEALKRLRLNPDRLNPRPDNPHRKNRLPLGVAARHNQLEAAEFLLSQGAYPDGPLDSLSRMFPPSFPANDKGKTPLIHAARHASPEMIKLLLRHGAEPEVRDLLSNTPLCHAIEAGNWEAVKTLLEHNANPASAREGLHELLAKSAENGDFEKLSFLLKHGIKPEDAPLSNRHAFSFALSKAAESNELEAARLLLNNEVDPNPEHGDASVPLVQAAKAGHSSMVRLLLAHGADIDMVDETCDKTTSQTALHAAAETGNISLARLLLSNGADLETDDYDGRTPLTAAIDGGHNELAKILCRDYHAKIDWDFESEMVRQTPLFAAARQNDPEMLSFLLAEGANPNAHNMGQMTALMVAQNAQNAQKLIDAGANLEDKDRQGFTALQHHTQKNNLPVIKRLLAGGARIDEPDHSLNTPLMLAAMNNEPETVSFLLSQGASPTALNVENDTALSYAVGNFNLKPVSDEANRTKIVRALLDAGSDINHLNDDDETPLMIAARYLRPQTTRLLLERGAANRRQGITPSPLSHAAKTSKSLRSLTPNALETIKILIASDPQAANLNRTLQSLFKNRVMRTNHSIHNDHPDLAEAQWIRRFKDVKGLIEAGVPISSGKPDIFITLNHAARHNQDEAVEFLLKNGIATDARYDATSPTALMSAAQHGATRAADVLLESGANPNYTHENGDTPFKLATKQGCMNTMLRLLQAGADPAPHLPTDVDELNDDPAVHRRTLAMSWPLKLANPDVKAYVESQLGSARSDEKKVVWNLQPKNRQWNRYLQQHEANRNREH